MPVENVVILLQLFISAFVVPMWLEIRRLNKEVNRLNRAYGKVDERLEECLKRNSQAGTWQAGQERQRDMLLKDKLERDDTPSPDEEC